MGRINNKVKKALSSDSFEKHPGKFLKRDASGRVRRTEKEVVEEFNVEKVRVPSQNDKNALRKQSGNCPICLSRLKRNARGTRFCHKCDECQAQLKPDLHCDHCGTNRVWGIGAEFRCKGCGKKTATP